MGYGGPTFESSRTGRKTSQQVFGRGDTFLPSNSPRRTITKARTCCEEMGMHNDWSGCTTHTKMSYHGKGNRYIETTWSLPIFTMTYECGIGMSAGGFKKIGVLMIWCVSI